VAESPRTVFLDRDGVINRKAPEGRYITRWADFAFLPGAVEALRRLRASGSRLVIVTNQRGVARGAMTLDDVAEIHQQMQAALRQSEAAVDAIYVCPHEEGACNCRKPQLGLFRQALTEDPDIDLSRAVAVGDSRSDLVAANALGCRSCFVGTAERLAEIRQADRDLRVDASARSLLDLVTSGEFGR